ncbi:B12-binding domain-containing radical SAM protein [Clostridium gasigenes]|uniref:B12-binding domain-containing radical SAM protein n=1 Tax=Clostridium gasigenes TaxID=94869 RepID=UPI001438678D|nr:radical SAM protein [Clostridium gasigenes]MBU3103441.1 B12-binding domain-containing radical SAM protein [Clostridium gasigenes]MBU3130868.1 B12-binding domain-containing radical SAM protein [Clostridium gasigenes]NKF07153.1 B12-binding domain-containing radical SAM protein [Clostridium gasigenes]QSW18136.1 B12-binding domain-containing radical SAM protein [Clostridium gasigenes]
MKIKFILPALEESKSPYWRPIKYSLFPPLGLATLASLCSESDEIEIVDEHVEKINLDDEPDLVCIESYITNAHRAYEIADSYRKRGIKVAIGGIHATSMQSEAKKHADAVLLGLGEASFPKFLSDLRAGKALEVYEQGEVSLDGLPLPRRDLFKKDKYLVPNSMVFSRGCPNKCSFCYVNSFYKNGKSFYAYKIDRILEEIESMPGKHLYFLDDNLFADKKLSKEIFREMRGMKKVFQGAITIDSVFDNETIELAYEAGFRSAFIGFESINEMSLVNANKRSNLGQDYSKAIKRLDELGIMINGSFIFGLDNDTKDVFDRTTEWAINSGIATATNHILTPYPGTVIYEQMKKDNRILTDDWTLYDTRHLVFKHPNISKEEMEAGYNRAYENFYKWGNIVKCSGNHEELGMKLKHLTYAGAWKKFEPVWNFLIKNEKLFKARGMLVKTLK